MCKKDKIQNIIELLNKQRTYDENISCGIAFDRWVSDADLALIIDALKNFEKVEALDQLLEWALESYSLDILDEEYELYKDQLTDDMTYKEMLIKITQCYLENKNNNKNKY